MMQVQIISKETIKPSSPTPPHLRVYKLSLLDQLSGRVFVSRVLFYTTNAASALLKKSLSETLTRYYPFAGRLSDGAFIDCNDEGVEFFEAQVSCSASAVLKQPDPGVLHSLFPSGVLGSNSHEGSLVVIQISYFLCGGMAVSLCLSHKIIDAAAFCTFFSDWAAMARGEGEKVRPVFISSAWSSCSDETPLKKQEIELKKRSCVTRRFEFDASKIANLKEAVAADPSGVLKNPTRVEVVTALIYMCVRKLILSRPSMLIQTMNMRPKMVPPLLQNSIGNFSWHFTVPVSGEMERNLRELVTEMRKGMSGFYDKYGQNFTMNEWFTVVGESMKEAKGLYDGMTDLNVFSCSSWCGLPIYEVNFGWGKPIWVAIPGNVFKNTFVLKNGPFPDGRIEAWVTLDERDMEVFESDEELLAFSSLNPSVLVDEELR